MLVDLPLLVPPHFVDGEAAEGAMDASNMLKPALARGELRAIGATTLKEFQKHIEKDPALTRRFQPVYVQEPTVEDAVAILRGLKEKYELYHGVHISDDALISAVEFSLELALAYKVISLLLFKTFSKFTLTYSPL